MSATRKSERRSSKRPSRYDDDDIDIDGSTTTTNDVAAENNTTNAMATESDAEGEGGGAENNSDGGEDGKIINNHDDDDDDTNKEEEEDWKRALSSGAIAIRPGGKKRKHSGSDEEEDDDDDHAEEEDDDDDNSDDGEGEEPADEEGSENPEEDEEEAAEDEAENDVEDDEDPADPAREVNLPPPGRGCRVPACPKYKKAKSDGYCLEHFRIHRPGLERVEPDPKVAPPGRRCKAEGCNKYNKARCEGLCLTCFRAYRDGTLGLERMSMMMMATSKSTTLATYHLGGIGMEGDEDGALNPPMLPPVAMPDGAGNERRMNANTNTNDPLVDAGKELLMLDSPAERTPVKVRPTSSTPSSKSSPTASTARSGSKSSKFCNHDGCAKYRQTNCYGYCLTHKSLADPSRSLMRREMAALTSSLKKKTTNKSNLCKWPECSKYIQSNCNGYCLTHVKFANYEEEDEDDVCKVRVRLLGRLQNGFCQAILPDGMREEWGFGRGVPIPMVDVDGEMQSENEKGTERNKEGNGDEVEEMSVDEVDEEDERKQPPVVASMEVDEKHDDVKEEQDDESDATPESMDVDNDAGDTPKANMVVKDEDKESKPPATPEPTTKTPEKKPPITNDTDPGNNNNNNSSQALDFEVNPTPIKKSNGSTKCKAVDCPKNSQSHSHGFCRAHHNRYLICTGQCDSWECVCGERIASFQARCGLCHRWRGGRGGKQSPDKTSVTKPAASASVETAAVGSEDKSAADGIFETTSDDAPRIPKALTYVPPDSGVEIAAEPILNSKGRSLCKVVGCGKMDQSNNDGFCRMHFNMFAVADGVAAAGGGGEIVDGWTCVCGQVISGKQKRCGSCNKWRGGKRDTYTVTKGKFDDVSTDNIIGNHNIANSSNSPPFSSSAADFWKCDCGHKVPGSKSRCGQCHHWRGGKRTGGWKLGGVFGRDAETEDDGIDRTQDWTCCGMTLPAAKTRCGKCNGWRGGKRVAATGGMVKEKVPSGPPWECAKCHISNPGNKRRCGGCLAWKGSDAGAGNGSRSSKGSSRASSADNGVSDGPSAGWLCKKCNFDNFPTELLCMMCKLPRPNWQWHKKQQMISATATAAKAGATAATSVLGSNNAAATSHALTEAARAEVTAAATWPAQASGTAQAPLGNHQRKSTNLAGSMSSQAPARTSKASSTDSTTNSGLATEFTANHLQPPDERNYYGTYSDGVSYPYISIHFNFNQAYYHHHKYSYLNEGIKKSTNDSGGFINTSPPAVSGDTRVNSIISGSAGDVIPQANGIAPSENTIPKIIESINVAKTIE